MERHSEVYYRTKDDLAIKTRIVAEEPDHIGVYSGWIQEQAAGLRRLYHPKAETADLMAMDPSLVRRN